MPNMIHGTNSWEQLQIYELQIVTERKIKLVVEEEEEEEEKEEEEVDSSSLLMVFSIEISIQIAMFWT